MKYAILTAAVVAMSASANAFPKSCSEAFAALKGVCSEEYSLFSTDYWKCRTGANIAWGMCKVVGSQLDDAAAKRLTNVCADPEKNKVACEDELDKVVENSLKTFQSDEAKQAQVKALKTEIHNDIEHETAAKKLSPARRK